MRSRLFHPPLLANITNRDSHSVAHPVGTVLVVDDLDPNARLLELLLTRDGHRVQRAHDGLEALQMIAREQPDLVLMDVMMPGLDGFEACLRPKGDPANCLVPVVMVTALTDSRDRIRVSRKAG